MEEKYSLEDVSEDVGTYEESLDSKIEDKFEELLALIKEAKEKFAGTENGRYASILYTETEKVFAFYTYIPYLGDD